MKLTPERRKAILDAYYRRWYDSDQSEEKKHGVVTDVMKCLRAKTRKGRIAAFDSWGDPGEAVEFWMARKRRIKERKTEC